MPEHPTEFILEGGELSETQARELEKQVLSEPQNLELRLKLVGFYFTRRRYDPVYAKLAQPHLLWFIRNRPKSTEFATPYFMIFQDAHPEFFAEGKEAWLEQISRYPTDPRVMANAASYFALNEPKRARELLELACQLEPENSEWGWELANQIVRDVRPSSRDEYLEANRQALALYEKVLARSAGLIRFYRLPTVARTALKAHQDDRAKAYAEELLSVSTGYREDWNYGNALYDANVVLGHLALKNGEVEEAETYLLAAGDSPGSPQLDTFGPDLRLADQMLAKGRDKAVIVFLERIAKFWNDHQEEIEEWIVTIRNGKSPSWAQYIRW
ncbi:MAG: hypothetical protein AAGK14_11155 [Verrucomicrobiota bacterium]